MLAGQTEAVVTPDRLAHLLKHAIDFGRVVGNAFLQLPPRRSLNATSVGKISVCLEAPARPLRHVIKGFLAVELALPNPHLHLKALNVVSVGGIENVATDPHVHRQ